MTIAVGFQCSDGVVLCADKQFTSKEGRFKYQGGKLASSQRGFISFIYTFAGDPDRAEVIFLKLCRNLGKKIKDTAEDSPRERIGDALEEIYSDPQSDGLETLLGIRWKHFGPMLFRTNSTTVVGGFQEHIGYGDSSVLRYLSDFLPLYPSTVDEATVLGTYMVFVAGRFVDQCGDEPEHAILHDSGPVITTGRGVFDNQRARFFHCEKEIGKQLRALLLSGGRE